jgi:hypothetical protein
MATLPPPVPTRTKLVPLGGDGRNELDVPVFHVPVVVPKSYVQVAAAALVGSKSRMLSVDARLRPKPLR